MRETRAPGRTDRKPKDCFREADPASAGRHSFVEHPAVDDGEMIFEHACQLGCEGIVSKRLGSRYVSGRTRDGIKVKNPNALAVKQEVEAD